MSRNRNIISGHGGSFRKKNKKAKSARTSILFLRMRKLNPTKGKWIP